MNICSFCILIIQMHGKGETGIIASIIAPYPSKSSLEVCNNIVMLETWERALAREEVAAGSWKTMFSPVPIANA